MHRGAGSLSLACALPPLRGHCHASASPCPALLCPWAAARLQGGARWPRAGLLCQPRPSVLSIGQQVGRWAGQMQGQAMWWDVSSFFISLGPH